MSNEFYRESLRARLSELQKQLEEKHGFIRMGGLTLAHGKQHTVEEVCEDMIHILEAFLAGNMKKLPPIGDSRRAIKLEDDYDQFTLHSH